MGSSSPSTAHSISRGRSSASSTIALVSNSKACSIAAASSARVLHAADAHRRAEVRRLDEEREAERLAPRDRGGAGSARSSARRSVTERHDGQLGRGEQPLHHVLVHADRRAEHARADVGHAGELEQALHAAVLAHRPVQHREDDVDAARGAPAERASVASPPGAGARRARRRASAWLRRARRGSRAAPSSSASSWRSQRPPLSMPTRTGSKRSRSSDSTTKRAERSEISCSAERPPKRTATRSFRCSAMARGG